MRSPLDMVEAVSVGDLERVRRLLDEDESLADASDEGGVSALMHALYRGRTDIVQTLAAAKVDFDLFEATVLGKTRLLERIAGGNPRVLGQWSADGFTALHLAAFFGQGEAARTLIELGADPALRSRNIMEVTPLHSAAAGNHTEIVRMLLACGAPVDARQQHGFTALHSAANNGNEAVVALLLEFGADRSAVADDGKSAADFAARAGHAALAARLRS